MNFLLSDCHSVLGEEEEGMAGTVMTDWTGSLWGQVFRTTPERTLCVKLGSMSNHSSHRALQRVLLQSKYKVCGGVVRAEVSRILFCRILNIIVSSLGFMSVTNKKD